MCQLLTLQVQELLLLLALEILDPNQPAVDQNFEPN